jgi:hypothetical protein
MTTLIAPPTTVPYVGSITKWATCAGGYLGRTMGTPFSVYSIRGALWTTTRDSA